MPEIRDLDISLDVVGWDKYGGKSFNVWGLVDFPPELIKHILKFKAKTYYNYDPNTGKKFERPDKKSPVWTAYDNYIYSQLALGNTDFYIPKISATFKSCFTKYGAVAENIGMRLAMALDMPTSYNYLVKFDPQKYPQIVENYPNKEILSDLQPYGIVSIDFLQVRPTASTKRSVTIDTSPLGNAIQIEALTDIEGDKLVTFEDALRKYHFSTNNLDGAENLIENWINVVDEMARRELQGVPKERLNKVTNHIHSRIARSFLLKDSILGDCDFTAYNGGVVMNAETKKFRYAPNHDFGESFNGLIKNKLEFDPYHGMTQADIDRLPPAIREKFLESVKNEKELSISEIARRFASSTSERNFYYVISNFPNSSKEFFENLDKLFRDGRINKIIDSYTRLTCNGKPLLTKEEAELFKEYLTERICHICTLYVDHLQKNNQPIPEMEI